MSRTQLPPRDTLANEAARQLGLLRNDEALEELTRYYLGLPPRHHVARDSDATQQQSIKDIKYLASD